MDMISFALIPIGLLFSLLYFAFSIFTLVDCAQNEPSEGTTKITWILIILFGLGVGPLIYFLVRRPERISLYGK
jgi:hypothetical protein